MTRAGEHASAAAGRGASAAAEEAASRPNGTRRIVPARRATPVPAMAARGSARDAYLRSMATAVATAGAGVNRGDGSRRCRRRRSSLHVVEQLALALRDRRLAIASAFDVAAVSHRVIPRLLDVRLVRRLPVGTGARRVLDAAARAVGLERALFTAAELLELDGRGRPDRLHVAIEHRDLDVQRLDHTAELLDGAVG